MILNEFGFEEFNDTELSWWKDNPKIVICYTANQFERYLVRMQENEYKDECTAYLGKITNEIADRIKEETCIDICGKIVAVDKRGLEHAITHHSDQIKEEKRAQIPIDYSLFLRVPDIVNNFDFCIDTSRHNVKSFRLGKQYDSGCVIIVEIVSNRRNTLRTEDLWKTKKSLHHGD